MAKKSESNAAAGGVKDSLRAVGMRIMRMGDVVAKVSMTEPVVREMIERGEFPAGFHIVPGGRAVGFLEEDIDRWIMQRRIDGALGAVKPQAEKTVAL